MQITASTSRVWSRITSVATKTVKFLLALFGQVHASFPISHAMRYVHGGATCIKKCLIRALMPSGTIWMNRLSPAYSYPMSQKLLLLSQTLCLTMYFIRPGAISQPARMGHQHFTSITTMPMVWRWHALPLKDFSACVPIHGHL